MTYPNNKYNLTLKRKYMNEYFFDAIRHILKAIGADDTKQVLTKLYVKNDMICATNGYILSWINLSEGSRELFRDYENINSANNGLYTVLKNLSGTIKLEQSCYTDVDYPDVMNVIPEFSNYHTCFVNPGWNFKNNIALVKMALYNKKHDIDYTAIEKTYSPNCKIYFNDNPFDSVVFENYFNMFTVFSLVMPVKSDFKDIKYHDKKDIR